MDVLECAHCGKKLHGRSDKRFCNDDCRNRFNRYQRQQARGADHPNLPQILKLIKANYEILKKSGPKEENTHTFGEHGGITSTGINPKFYTSTVRMNDQTWYCCFDYCWRESDEGYWEIGWYPEQASIN